MREPLQYLYENETDQPTEMTAARTPHLRAVPLDTLHEDGSLHAVDVELEKPRNGFSARVALALSPLYNFLYDVQMCVGKGVRRENHRVTLPNIPRHAPTLKIAYLSDFHLGPSSGRFAARQAWKLAREFSPDMVLLGGDYLWADGRGLPSLVRELQRWKWNRPKAGIYAVPGNHDYGFGIENLQRAFEACGVQMLRNEAKQLPDPWDNVWLTGVEDPDKGAPDPGFATRDVPKGACEILLAHSPEILAHDTKRFALTLCGDTHGGQIVWPSGDAILQGNPWGRQFMHGLPPSQRQLAMGFARHRNVHLPIRCFAPPDVGLFEIAGRGATVSR